MNELCPICQRKNQCGMDNLDDACWCTTATFPSIDVGKLDLPNRCICSNCAEKLGATRKRLHKLSTN